MDINFFLDKGISLTEQGYDGLDHDVAVALKYISHKQNEKMDPDKNKNTKNPTMTSFGNRGFKRNGS